eukprot:2561637-Ditylum_brightwellii.AAC.1
MEETDIEELEEEVKKQKKKTKITRDQLHEAHNIYEEFGHYHNKNSTTLKKNYHSSIYHCNMITSVVDSLEDPILDSAHPENATSTNTDITMTMLEAGELRKKLNKCNQTEGGKIICDFLKIPHTNIYKSHKSDTRNEKKEK